LFRQGSNFTRMKCYYLYFPDLATPVDACLLGLIKEMCMISYQEISIENILESSNHDGYYLQHIPLL